MKKMIYLMTAVIVTLAFNACSVNDNPATPGNPSGQAVITVNTAAMYEEVNLAELIERNLPQTLCISDTVLIYDQNGHLVNKLGTVTKNLEPLTITADDLPNGTYTLVAWQSGYFDYETTKPFVLADEEELATVKLVPSTGYFLYAHANGLTSATVTVNGNSIEATFTPKLIGSFVNLKSAKACDEYDFDEIELSLKGQVCEGIWLDPARPEEDRRIMGHENKITRLAYLELAETEYMFYTLAQGDDVKMDVVTWTYVDGHWKYTGRVREHLYKLPEGSRMVYYIDIDRLSYQPPFFGPEDQFSVWKADRDAGILVNDPYLKWGDNLAEVEAHKKAKQYWYEGNDHLELWEEVGWHFWYWIADSFTEQYLFDTEDGQNLKHVVCFLRSDDLSIDDFNKSLLLQGYTYSGKSNDSGIDIDNYLSADGKTEVLCYIDIYGQKILEYFPTMPKYLNHKIPAMQRHTLKERSLAPASSKVRSIVPDLHSSVLHSALIRDHYLKK